MGTQSTHGTPSKRYWPSVPPAEQEAFRARAVAAYHKAGSLRGAAALLEAEGAEFASFGLVKVAVKRAMKAEVIASAMPAPPPPTEPPSGQPKQPKGPPDYKRVESDDGKATVEFVTSKRIRTLEDAIAHAEVDTTVWRAKRYSVTSWETGMKVRDFDASGKIVSETPVVKGLWRVSVDLERILPKAWHDATEAIIKRMEGYSPKFPAFKIRKQPGDAHMLELDIFDIHFGKLAWEPETGSNYDLRIAESVYKNAFRDLLNRSAGFNIDKVLIPIGNDMFHVDSQNNTTTAGTPQDVDGRQAKIIEVGTMSLIWGVEEALAEPTVETVELVLVPGNHDWKTSLHLAREVRAWFRLNDRVIVDVSPKARKARLYGQNLIGFTHGNEEAHRDLPITMAQEFRDLWCEARYAEIHVGHWHRAKELRTMPLETYGGVGVRFLMSLSGIDAWHYRRGFSLSQRAAECYLWGREPGMVGHFVANVREN